MKKKYSIPVTRAVAIDAASIIAQSPDGSVGMDRQTGADPNVEVMSKEADSNTLWDEIW